MNQGRRVIFIVVAIALIAVGIIGAIELGNRSNGPTEPDTDPGQAQQEVEEERQDERQDERQQENATEEEATVSQSPDTNELPNSAVTEDELPETGAELLLVPLGLGALTVIGWNYAISRQQVKNRQLNL